MITTLDKGTALIIIDLQKGIVQLPLAKPFNEILVKVLNLVDAFHEAALPVVFVNVDHTGAAWSKTRKDSNQQRPTTTVDWNEIIPELKATESDFFITKHTWGAFFETELHNELQKRYITGIVLAGIATSIGVEGTARQASELGYNLCFAEDAMTDLSAEGHEHTIKRIFPRIGEVDCSEKIIATLKSI